MLKLGRMANEVKAVSSQTSRSWIKKNHVVECCLHCPRHRASCSISACKQYIDGLIAHQDQILVVVVKIENEWVILACFLITVVSNLLESLFDKVVSVVFDNPA